MPHIDEPPGDSCSVQDSVTVDVQTPEDALVEIKSPLLHQHLPEIAEAGILDVDHETSIGQEGDRFDVATALLEVV